MDTNIFSLSTWKCEKHGFTTGVISFHYDGTHSPEFCIRCILDKLQELGLKGIEKLT